MMGHRANLKSGDAVDAIRSRRHDHNWRPGERKAIKRQLGKRARGIARLALRMLWGAITLQFITCGDPASWAIRTFQRGWCSHVDSVMDDDRLLGARLDGGVAVRPPNYEKFTRVERVVIAVPYYKEKAYYDFLKAQIGKPYDKLAIVSFAVNRNWRETDACFVTSWLRPGSNRPRWCASWRLASTV